MAKQEQFLQMYLINIFLWKYFLALRKASFFVLSQKKFQLLMQILNDTETNSRELE